MKKLVALAIAGTLACSLAAAPKVFALDTGPESMTLNAQKKHPDVIHGKDKKHVNNFPHRKHQNEFLKGNEQYSKFKYTDDWTCSACHHKSHKGEQPQSCFKCKDVNKMLDKVGGAKRFNKLFHSTCKKCHSKMAKAGKKTGPTKCNGCHKRK